MTDISKLPAAVLAPPTRMGEREPHIAAARTTRVRVAAWALSLALGFIQAWRSRHTMNPDGVSYLDLADAYVRGDWSAAINAYWSPLYSWVLAGAMLLFRPSPYWEFTVVHLVNFGVYVLSLGAFDLLVKEIIRTRREAPGMASQKSPTADDEWAWWVLGYALFLWSALGVIGLTVVTPDMCVAALAYLAAAILVRLRNPAASWWVSLALGVTLGFGYLAKAAMFPLTLVFIVAGVVAWRVSRAIAVRRAVVAVVGFAAVALPFIVALSVTKGYPTWGAVGKLAYVWCVDGSRPSPPCDDDSTDYGIVQATRQISQAPDVYEFGAPIGGTYPPWYDPSHWYPDVEIRLLPVRMASKLLIHSLEYLRLAAPIVAVLLVVAWVAGRSAVTASGVRPFVPLMLPASAALVMYGVVYIQPRYLGPFLVLVSLGAFAAVRPPDERSGNRLLGGAAIALGAVLVTPLLVSLSLNALVLITQPQLAGRSAHRQWQVAEELRRAGVRPGDAVAAIGNELAPAWARLARVRVVAQMPAGEADLFWASDSAARSGMTRLLASTGARAIVTSSLPAWASRGAWRAVDATSYSVFLIRDAASPTAPASPPETR